MEITNNIHSLAQQLFQLIQHQKMEITINQQTIQYQDTRKTLQPRTQKKTENTVDKIIAKVKLAIIKELTKESLYQELTKETWNCLPEGHNCQNKSSCQAEKEIGHNCNSRTTTTNTTESLFIIQKTQPKPSDP
ncbi:hypothetical protein G9A89_019967 [Geosiphon pyriformis]|nr:hypothetical protein G9A89_019967 [Geosiphon pyriformis]